MTPRPADLTLTAVLLFGATVFANTTLAQNRAETSPNRPRTPRGLDGVSVSRDLAYNENGHDRQRLDLYVPESSEPLPLIIWIHGGGWQAGNKASCPPARNGFAERGYAVASIGYRLSGQATFPAQIEDCKAAISWLRQNAQKFNLDVERFGVWGSSAGGHLAAMVGTTGEVSEFGSGPSSPFPSHVRAVCDFYGPTDFHAFVTEPGYESHAAKRSPESKLIGGPVLESPEEVKKVNPITYVTDDDPPFLIVHGDQDKTVPINQSELLFEALQNADVSVRFHTIHGAGHGGPAFSEPDIAQMVENFFDQQLKDTAAENPVVQPGTAKRTESNASASRQARRTNNRSTPSAPLSWDAVTDRFDANDDGKIAKEEFRGGPNLFQRIDRNRDGFITQKEHESAMEILRRAGR